MTDLPGPTPSPAALIDALKRALRRQGLTYAAVARRMGLSEASIKRMLSRGRLTLGQMLQLADIAGISRNWPARPRAAIGCRVA